MKEEISDTFLQDYVMNRMFKKIAFMWNIIFYNNVKVFVTSDQFNALLLNRSIVFLNPTQTFEYIWLLNHFVLFFYITSELTVSLS